MDVFVARTAMVKSDIRSGAHADGYDYADYQADDIAWAKLVWDVAGTPLEGFLFLCAARDYASRVQSWEECGTKPMARGRYCDEHVAGQIDRALEIADEI